MAKWGSYYYIWVFVKESSWDEEVFLLYENIIQPCVYWENKHTQKKTPTRELMNSFCGPFSEFFFFFWVCHHIHILGMSSPACVFLILLERMFHQGFSQKKQKKMKEVIIMVMVITWPVLLARWILNSPGGTLCHGHLSYIYICAYNLMSTNCLLTHLR